MKLSGKLPKGGANGLVPISERMVADPERVWASTRPHDERPSDDRA